MFLSFKKVVWDMVTMWCCGIGQGMGAEGEVVLGWVGVEVWECIGVEIGEVWVVVGILGGEIVG